MVILNPDGSVFKPTGSLNQFDPEDPVHDLFNSLDQEALEIGGTPIFYYDIFIQFENIDKLYLEDRTKIWSPVPIQLQAMYEPIASQNNQGLFGIDSPDDMMFQLNKQDVLNRLGGMPKVGARIFTPHKRENWVIVQRNAGGFQNWGEIRLELYCSRFQESLTDGSSGVSQSMPDFKV